jgi:membrane-bound lytic murein transglycosylase MltF
MKLNSILWTIFFHILMIAHAGAQHPNDSKALPEIESSVFADLIHQEFTGDFDEMIQRRLIRVLVTNSKTHFFVDKGTQRGLVHEMFVTFEEELNKKLNKKNIRVHVVFVPVSRDDIIPALLEGRGDIAAANLTITPKRKEMVDFTDPTFTHVNEIVVTGPGFEPISGVQDLSGQEVYIRKSSSFFEHLEVLNTELAQNGQLPVRVRFAPEELETEDILEMVNAGLVNITIADSHIADFWSQIFDQIVLHPKAVIHTGGHIGLMIRKNSPMLKKELNEFIARYPKGSKSRNILLQKYLKNTKFAKNATSTEEIAKFRTMIDLFRKYGDTYELDFLLIAAQGYQESRLDHNVRSPVGAVGVMQVMPKTGEELSVGDITELEPNIHAGVKYIRLMMGRYYENEPMTTLNKWLFTFASYNAGPARIAQLRREAAQRGLDPNKWFNNVEVVAAEKIGRETVQYVSNIYKYYLAYTIIMGQQQERMTIKKNIVN